MLTLGKKTLSVPILQGGMGVGVSLGGLAGAHAIHNGFTAVPETHSMYTARRWRLAPWCSLCWKTPAKKSWKRC